ncbi:MAG: zinc-dependent alcohol dehydrogenase family protein [Leptolinea sp.]|nr:zinc-dependent alcohol dehydrogenase family protein [Leptolinea sp.]
MKAVVIEEFGKPMSVQNVPDPKPTDNGVVIKVRANGLCRSDWHAWMGHDTDVVLPHVPGHEMAGDIIEVGKNVHKWKPGDRVTLPFVCACGSCPQCLSGNHQVCDHQFQPGFTHWGSFAQYVAIDRADINVVRLPDSMDYVTAASLGCRFVTSFRAVIDQGKVMAGQWVAVHGCGGVGLSAIMIASAAGANVVAIDIADNKLELARSVGAKALLNAKTTPNVVEAVMDITNGGAHVSLDALGNPTTCFNSVANLRKRGKHIQVGLMLGGMNNSPIPLDKVVARELEIYGSHGIQAYKYPQLFEFIMAGKVDPSKMIGKTITLEESAIALADMDSFEGAGVKIIDRF